MNSQTDNFSVLIFSKDRALQLNALLESIAKWSDISRGQIFVLHKYDEAYLPSLSEVMKLHPGVNFIEETNFKKQVCDFLEREEKYCAFLVDDIIFKDHVSLQNITTFMDTKKRGEHSLFFSLRLGLNLKKCYTMQLEQKIPNGEVRSTNDTKERGYFVWNWAADGNLDWKYPISADGHIFRRSTLRQLSKQISFRNPNTFEGNFHSLIQQILRRSHQNHLGYGVCYLNSRIVNFPFNKVQNVNNNIHGDISQEQLLSFWNDGKKLDIDAYDFFDNESAHQIVELVLKERGKKK